MKKHLVRIIVGLSLTLFFLLNATNIIKLDFTRQLELWAYDQRLNLFLSNSQDSRIVIVDIDEKSLAEDGRWPWSRNKVAAVVDNLINRYHAAIVGFDVVFAERDESSGLAVLERFGRNELVSSREYLHALARVKPRLDYDAILAEKLKNKPVVLGYYFTGSGEKQSGHIIGLLPPPVFTAENFHKGNTNFISMTGYGANIPKLQSNALSGGHFNPATDLDGVVRRVPMLLEYNNNYYESLSLAMVRGLLGMPELKPGLPDADNKNSDYGKLEWLSLSDIRIPVDNQATALVPYRGKQGSFPYVSMSDVLHARVEPELLEGAIILIGATAPGLMDLRAAPVSSVYPGVEVHANMISGILDQNIKHAPSYAMGAEVLVLFVSGALLSLLLPMLSPLKSIVLTLLLLASSLALNLAAWQHNLVLPLASSIILIPLIFAFNMSYGFLLEARTKRQITGLFGQYVPAPLVAVMSKDPDSFSMEPESREMTVLFSDIRDFTSISEGLEPRQLSQILNEYLSAMTGIIQKHNGTIDKYIGDAIMAFWGAPLRDPDHALHAVRAAIEMQQAMQKIRADFGARGWPALQIGIGVNTGLMSVGNMGSSFRMAYTVMGDAVNLGSRLEGLTKEYGAEIIVGETTRNLLPDYRFRKLDHVRVKGKTRPVIIHELICSTETSDTASDDQINSHNEALAFYYSREWDQAEALFLNLSEQFPEQRLYNIYLERIAHFRAFPPPEDWDGVFQHSTK